VVVLKVVPDISFYIGKQSPLHLTVEFYSIARFDALWKPALSSTWDRRPGLASAAVMGETILFLTDVSDLSRA
jgi:hypothetical protein